MPDYDLLRLQEKERRYDEVILDDEPSCDEYVETQAATWLYEQDEVIDPEDDDDDRWADR